MTVPFTPAGYHSVTPYLTVAGAEKLIRFLQEAFAAEETEKLLRPDGSVNHAEVRIGDSIVMLGEPEEESSANPSTLYLYVPNTDETYKRALEAGASSLMEPTDQFYGDRNAAVKDPAGNSWWIATHFENVPPEELQRRAEQASRQ